jgi:hypothetical protein
VPVHGLQAKVNGRLNLLSRLGPRRQATRRDGAQRSRSEPHVQDCCSPNLLRFAVLAGTPPRKGQTVDPTTSWLALNGSSSWNHGWGFAGSVEQRHDGPPTSSRRMPVSFRTIYAACVLTLAASTAVAETKTIATAGKRPRRPGDRSEGIRGCHARPRSCRRGKARAIYAGASLRLASCNSTTREAIGPQVARSVATLFSSTSPRAV